MFNQIFSSFTFGWLGSAMLAFLFVALLFKPDRIQRPGYFWKGCLLFVLSLVVPAVFSLFVGEFDPDKYLGSGFSVVKVLAIIQPVLFSLSVLMVFYSLIPASNTGSYWPFSGKQKVKQKTRSTPHGRKTPFDAEDETQ